MFAWLSRLFRPIPEGPTEPNRYDPKQQEFTSKARDAYLNDPGLCPFCGDRNISGTGREEMDLRVISVRVSCDTCEHEWWEVYVLKDIDTVRTFG